MTDVSVSTVVFDGHPLETAFEELAALGLRHVEPAYIHGYMDFDETAFSDAAARACRARLSAAGLSARAISAHIDLGAPDAPERLVRRLRFAAGIGATIVITNAATRSAAAAMRHCLETTLPQAEAARTIIALENPGHGRDALIPDGAAGAALIARFRSDWLRLNYDVANVLTYAEGGLRPEHDIEAAKPALAHLHFKDVRESEDGWVYAPLGEGNVALERVARSIAGTSVPVGVELPLRLSRRRGGNPARLRPPLDLSTIRSAVRLSLDRLRQWMRPTEVGGAWTTE